MNIKPPALAIMSSATLCFYLFSFRLVYWKEYNIIESHNHYNRLLGVFSLKLVVTPASLKKKSGRKMPKL